MQFLKEYEKAASIRKTQHLPPLALNALQVAQLIQIFKSNILNQQELEQLKYLFVHRIEPGVHEAAHLKATFLSSIVQSKTHNTLFTPSQALEALGTMQGGSNVLELIRLLQYEPLAKEACDQLSKTVFVFESYYDITKQYRAGNPWAKAVLANWAKRSWLYTKPVLPTTMQVIVFKIPDAVTVQDFSPPEAMWNRNDLPLHAQAFLKHRDPKALSIIQSLKNTGYPIILVTPQLAIQNTRSALVQTGLHALLYHIGEPFPYNPNRYYRGLMMAEAIGDLFHSRALNTGSWVMQGSTTNFNTGDIVQIHPYLKQLVKKDNTKVSFELQKEHYEMWQAQGRLSYLLGNQLSVKASRTLRESGFHSFQNKVPSNFDTHYTLAQKIVGKACGTQGVIPGQTCHPCITTLDCLTNDLAAPELESLPAIGHSVELVMEYFKPQRSSSSAGIMLKPGDGMLHGWLNHMILPDSIGVSDNHYTRAPLGLSFHAASDQISVTQTIGVLPLQMPESVLVKFVGHIQPGITIQDIVYAIPYMASKKGFVNEHQNPFRDRILEIEGLPDLEVEQASELIAASVEYSTQACVVALELHAVQKYVVNSIEYLQQMIQKGYDQNAMLNHRLDAMQTWLDKPSLLSADPKARYADTLEINLDEIKEPLLASLNDVWNVQPLSNLETLVMDDVFVGPFSMGLRDYYVVGDLLKQKDYKLSTQLWVSPTTKWDMQQLIKEGYYTIYGKSGAHTEMPENWLCRKNALKKNTRLFATSHRYFFNQNFRKQLTGYLGSSHLSALIAVQGRIPTLKEYKAFFI